MASPLIPTAEVPVTNIRDEIIEEAQLLALLYCLVFVPKRVRQAKTRGLIRQHHLEK